VTGDLLVRARAHLDDAVRLRRRLHRQPELGLELPQTQQAIVDELERLGLKPERGRALSSVTAVIGAARPGRTIVLRADMDALPLTEETGLDFGSEVAGRMHACGHDTHVSMLLGGARLLVEELAADPDSLPGPVVLMFQPGEEGFFGARLMLEEGLLDGLDRQTTRGFAIHISTQYASGEVHTKPGALLASADNFAITVRGRGGHASAPHFAQDPILVAAEIVTALQTSLTREVNVFDPAVVTVAHLVAGTTQNIIPDMAWMEGTYRTVSDAQREAVTAMVRRVAEGVASTHGLSADVSFEQLYPVTVNDDAVFERVREIAIDLVGEADVVTMKAPIMGAEDWSYVLQQIPGAMAFVGARPHDADDTYPNNHSNLVVFEESAMAIGAALYAKVALEL
jgi:amidohydrolase